MHIVGKCMLYDIIMVLLPGCLLEGLRGTLDEVHTERAK